MLIVVASMRPATVILLLVMTACSTGDVSNTTADPAPPSTDTSTSTTSSTTATTSTTSSTTATTSTTTTSTVAVSSEAQLVDQSFIGIWPYRTREQVLAAAVDGLEVSEPDLIADFLSERIGWELGKLVEGTDGTDSTGFTFESSGGTFFAGTRIVGHSPDGSAVVAIAYASSLDSVEDGWGPGVQVGESEEGWSAIVYASPIENLTSRPEVTGPLVQVSYGEWESDLVEIGPDGASIQIPFEPTMPGVLSIWYHDTAGVAVGFAVLALPPGPFAAG